MEAEKEKMILEMLMGGDWPVLTVSGCTEKSKGKMTVGWEQSWILSRTEVR